MAGYARDTEFKVDMKNLNIETRTKIQTTVTGGGAVEIAKRPRTIAPRYSAEVNSSDEEVSLMNSCPVVSNSLKQFDWKGHQPEPVNSSIDAKDQNVMQEATHWHRKISNQEKQACL
ncbi:hypothetical protein T265_00424 [Opisthorchis viverrini]|uniref:Uncharacterized protein n=1 Tax=Opisthorchis viverrini TaxID=6198 RepID=A0A075A210_OPIVI|nr:hypothetical protein T265_00424 [Opisthorchis viverrini]KER33738.1 hypothetical protein T265_00424 [Opisthorchis viverrini]